MVRAAMDCKYDTRSNALDIVRHLTRLELMDEVKIRTFISSPDRVQNYKLFECVVAHKFGAVPWGDIPDTSKQAKGVPHQDKGIDCMSPDLTHAIQAKWYKPGASISYTELSTFFTLGHIMGSSRFTIVTSARVTLSKTRPPNIDHVVIEDDELIQTLVDVLHDSRPADTNTPVVSLQDAAMLPAMKEVTPPPPTMDDHHVKRPPVLIQTNKSPTGVAVPIADRTCNRCGKDFPFPSGLVTHQQRKRPCQIPGQNPIGKVLCRYCRRGFTCDTSMYRHIRQNCSVARAVKRDAENANSRDTKNVIGRDVATGVDHSATTIPQQFEILIRANSVLQAQAVLNDAKRDLQIARLTQLLEQNTLA